MRAQGSLMSVAFSMLLIAGCGTTTAVDYPYDSCNLGDVCSSGLTCATSTLPASAGYSGAFCTSGCNTAADCVQIPQNYDAQCVNAQCYITCPSGGATCPYGTACLTFSDQNGNAINLCTP